MNTIWMTAEKVSCAMELVVYPVRTHKIETSFLILHSVSELHNLIFPF
jgi:hypothetical protein